MKITVDTDNLLDYGDGETALGFQQAVEEKAAAMLLAEISSTARDTIRQQLWELARESVRDTVAILVREATTRPIQLSTPWGESKGEPTTILEMIREELERYLMVTAQSQGSFGGRDKTPRNLRELIAQETQAVWNSDLAAAARKAREEVTGEVRAKALEAAVRVLNGEKP